MKVKNIPCHRLYCGLNICERRAVKRHKHEQGQEFAPLLFNVFEASFEGKILKMQPKTYVFKFPERMPCEPWKTASLLSLSVFTSVLS